MPTLSSLGITELPYYSLASGFLSGKYRAGTSVDSARAGGAAEYLKVPANVTLLGILDERARFAVEARFGLYDGEKKSFREIGTHLGVTAEAARRLVNRSLEGLRHDAEHILAA